MTVQGARIFFVLFLIFFEEQYRFDTGITSVETI
jgi:hypothetical protein